VWLLSLSRRLHRLLPGGVGTLVCALTLTIFGASATLSQGESFDPSLDPSFDPRTSLEGPGAPIADTLGWKTLPEVLAAHADRRPVLVYVHAPWCGPCRKMEREVFPAATPLLRRFARARLDFDDRDSALTVDGVTKSPFDWARHFGIATTPGFVFFDPNGTAITSTTGGMTSESFRYLPAYVATGAHRHESFEAYVDRVSAP